MGEKKLNLNLNKKGLSLNLTKEYGEIATQMNLCLGWTSLMDLDSFAILFDEKGKRLDTVSFHKESALGVRLSGDNTVGGGSKDEDKEIIYVDMKRLAPQIKKIELYANIYSAGKRTFKDVKNPFVRLVDASNKYDEKEILRYNLDSNENRNFNAYHFADLSVTDEGLIFTTVGEGLNGSIKEINDNIDRKYKINRPDNSDNNNNNNDNSNDNNNRHKGFFSKILGL